MTKENSLFEITTLKKILSTLNQTPVKDVQFSTKELQGGTVASVHLISGLSITQDDLQLPFNLVLKIQNKWERYRDPLSWRREYDLYRSNLTQFFTDSFRWPHCYHSEINQEEDKTHLWLEYIEGATSVNLDRNMLEKAAYELGRFQGRIYSANHDLVSSLTNLSSTDYAKNFYEHYRSWPVVYDYIRSDQTDLPKHLCNMLIDFDTHSVKYFTQIEALPKVLCHRDYWIANIFHNEHTIYAIDWDTSGWGYFGEDIASLIADEADNDHMVDSFEDLVSTYYKGFSDHANIKVQSDCVFTLIIAMFGYRLIEWYLMSPTEERKLVHLKTLENLYAINKRMDMATY